MREYWIKKAKRLTTAADDRRMTLAKDYSDAIDEKNSLLAKKMYNNSSDISIELHSTDTYSDINDADEYDSILVLILLSKLNSRRIQPRAFSSSRFI